jgi:hypothetical protein
MRRPVLLVRMRELESFLPYRRSSLKKLVAELVQKNILEKVKLTPTGRAVAFTETSVLRAQKFLMNLDGEEVSDDEQKVPRQRLVQTAMPRPRKQAAQTLPREK